jgi:opacity protein-like surface antigen
MKKLIALALLAALAVPAAVLAADAEVYAEVLSAYVYRGAVGNDEAVFQPGLDVTGPFGLGFSLWSSMNLTDNESPWYPDTAGKWGELNLGLNWTLPWEGPVSVTVGATYFVYPQDASEIVTDEETGEMILDEDGLALVTDAPADDGYEVYVELAAEDLLLSPTLTLCHDLANTDDWIVLLGIGHSLDLMDKLSLDLGATVGFAGEYYVSDNYGGDAGSAWSHVQLDAGLNYAVTETLSVGLKAAFSSILDSDVRDDIDAEGYYPEKDLFYGGLTASYSF